MHQTLSQLQPQVSRLLTHHGWSRAPWPQLLERLQPCETKWVVRQMWKCTWSRVLAKSTYLVRYEELNTLELQLASSLRYFVRLLDKGREEMPGLLAHLLPKCSWVWVRISNLRDRFLKSHHHFWRIHRVWSKFIPMYINLITWVRGPFPDQSPAVKRSQNTAPSARSRWSGKIRSDLIVPMSKTPSYCRLFLILAIDEELDELNSRCYSLFFFDNHTNVKVPEDLDLIAQRRSIPIF